MTTRLPIERVHYQHEALPGIGLELMTINELYATHLTRKAPGPEQLDFYLLLFITEGTGQHMVDFRQYGYEPGTVFTIAKEQVQQFAEQYTGKGWLLAFTETFVVQYFEQQEALQQLLLFNDALVHPCFQLSGEQRQNVVSLIGHLQAEYQNPVQDRYKGGILQSCLHTLLLTLERYKQSTLPPVAPTTHLDTFFHFKQLVEAHGFVTRNVADYADLLGCTPKKLNAITHAVVYKSAKAFINDTFLLQVKRLLVGTNLSIKEVAYKTGFDEPTNFIKYVKRYSGQLPSAFRSPDGQ